MTDARGFQTVYLMRHYMPATMQKVIKQSDLASTIKKSATETLEVIFPILGSRMLHCATSSEQHCVFDGADQSNLRLILNSS